VRNIQQFFRKIYEKLLFFYLYFWGKIMYNGAKFPQNMKCGTMNIPAMEG